MSFCKSKTFPGLFEICWNKILLCLHLEMKWFVDFFPQYLLLYLNPFSSPLVSSVLIFPLIPYPVLFLACLLFYSLLSRPISYSISSSNSLLSHPLTDFLSLNYKPHFRIRASFVLTECMFRLIKTKNTWLAVLLEMWCSSRVLLQTKHKGNWHA